MRAQKIIFQKGRYMRLSGKCACGILFCYNEELILKENIEYYLNEGVDLVIIDNKSTDSSMDIVNKFQNEADKYPGKIQDIIRIETDGYEWKKILRFACEYMHRNLSHYEWILLIDADAIYRSPVKEMPLLEFLAFVKKCGYNIIDGLLCEFYPTEKDDPSAASYVERIKYYTVINRWRQQKIFLYGPDIDFYSVFGHVCARTKPRIFITQFLYCHYPWISYEQGLNKRLKDRKPRYTEAKTYPFAHWRYLGLLPIKKDFIMKSKNLRFYKQEKIFMPRWRLFLIVKFRVFFEIRLFIKEAWRFGRVRRLRRAVADFWVVFKYDKTLAIKHAFCFAKKKFKKKTACPPAVESPHTFWGMASLAEAVRQNPYLIGAPVNYHFLMTNYCNARCAFCNQSFNAQPKREITLEKFKTMLSNIPTSLRSTFRFSGGGEPLLCAGFFQIIEYLNAHYPWIKIYIRTNGLLIGKYAKQLAKLNISRLEISIQASTMEKNSAILNLGQNNGTQNLFKGIASLNEHLGYCKRKINKFFCVIVSQRNIGDVPELIKKAAVLKVENVSVSFCRYYPHHYGEAQKSLFFNKNKYNEVIRKSKKLAKSLKIGLIYEPLFFKKFKERPCFQPWKNIVIDWDGDVYPCTGGEVWFGEKVKQDKYRFGNLLKEDLSQVLNSASYIMLRRTCSRYYKEAFIPECKNCHNTLCLKGPDAAEGHILKKTAEF